MIGPAFRTATFGDSAIGWLLVLLQLVLIPVSGLTVPLPGVPAIKACAAIQWPYASPGDCHPSDGAA